MERLQIEDRAVGPGAPAFLVAEVGQAHDGSLGTAHAYIDAVARTGADAIKFQTHIAAAESTPAERFRVAFSRQDATRYDYWKRMEFSPEAWAGLAAHAREKRLVFLSSPFSLEAADLLDSLRVAAWKVGSGEVQNGPLLERLARTGRPVLLSTGMSGEAELSRAVETVRSAGAPVALFQCTTAYPCPPEKVGLNVLAELRQRYGCPVGLSDHSGTIFPSLAAATLGANLLEVHVVFSRDCFGPDTPASVTLGELSELARGVRFIEAALRNPVDKEALAAELAPLRELFGRSLVPRRDLPAGHRLEECDLALRKPGGGLGPDRLGSVVGRTLRRPAAENQLLAEEDLD
jgi:N-acetylneuraminate synthase